MAGSASVRSPSLGPVRRSARQRDGLEPRLLFGGATQRVPGCGAEAVNEKWCGDLTEIPTDEGELYLATVEDLASRRLPGFAIGEHHDTELAKAALCMAAAVRGGDIAGVIFHSDKGGEYTGDAFAKTCQALGVIQSMGRVGSALDNAAAESFNSTLEWELLRRRLFATKDQARTEIAGFIDRYNHQRRHSSCEMLAPVAYEQVLAFQ